MKYIAIIDEEMLSNFRIDEPLVMVVTDKMGFTRGIELKPLKKGYWIERIEYTDELIECRWLECSNCHCDGDDAYNFCPCCGADMEGDTDEKI